uniref:Odorant binding protein 4 n=1 Tax=Sirex nitobei TaxID=1602346 RepID=A0A857N364_9HYME|nr:odorant binding protein 4 [Sirex nitobei]
MIERLILLACIFVLWSTVECAMTKEQLDSMIKALRKTCQSKTEVDTAILDGMRRGEFPEDPKFQCYLKCLLKTSRAIRDDKLDLNMMLKQADIMIAGEFQERTKSVMRKCTAETSSSDMCVAAYQFFKCFWETDSEMFIFM